MTLLLFCLFSRKVWDSFVTLVWMVLLRTAHLSCQKEHGCTYERLSMVIVQFLRTSTLVTQMPNFRGLSMLIFMCLSYKYLNTSLQEWGYAGTSAVLKCLQSLACCNGSRIFWLWNNFAAELCPCSIHGGVRSDVIYVAWNNDEPLSDMGYTWLLF